MKPLALIFTLLLLFACLLPAGRPALAESSAQDSLRLLCLNIGKADCLLLSFAGHHYLIDAGYRQNYPALENALAFAGVDHLDGVILTHCHKDHFGGLSLLAQSDIPVGAWYAASIYYDVEADRHPAEAAAAARGQQVTWLSLGDTVPVNSDASFSVLGPCRLNSDNENNNSLVLFFDSPAGSILFCGDMKEDEEDDLLARNLIPACTLLKVGHHGDNKATSKSLLAAAQPRAAVISTSTAEEPDTPAPSVLKKLAKISCDAYVTQDARDALVFTLSGGEILSVEDVLFPGIPLRLENLSLAMDVKNDTVTLTNNASETVTLSGYQLYSTKGDELFSLPDLSLAPGAVRVIGSNASRGALDVTLDSSRVWHQKKRDTAVLYDDSGRPVAVADNGIEE